MAIAYLGQKVQAPIAEVWAAITETDLMKEWYFFIQNFELKEGAVFEFWGDDESKTYLHRCEIKKIEAPYVFEHTWTHPEVSKGTSILRWELESIDDSQTLIKLKHSDLETFADAGPEYSPANFEFGWKGILHISLRNFLHKIGRQSFEITIPVKSSVVWKNMWSEHGYASWTSIFSEGSHINGTLKAGNRVQFLNGEGDGLYADVVFLQEGKLAIFSQLGLVAAGDELEPDEAVEFWTGALESYRLKESPAGTTVLSVELDNLQENWDYMADKFPKALEQLKQNCLK